MTTSQQSQGSSFAFDKGKLTLAKLKDKHYVDGSVEFVQVAFPDQYGRIWSTQVHAVHFIDSAESSTYFDFEGNPFASDVLGASVEGLEHLGSSLKLKPDMSTLRTLSSQKGACFVMADVYDQECEKLKCAPRQILKE